MSLNHSYPPDVYGEAYAYYNQNSYAHHDPQLSSPLDEAYSQFSPDDITGGSFITSPGNEVPTSDTGAIRPVVFTDFSYTPGSQPSSWPESAYTQFSSSPYSPFPPTPGVSTYESNQSSGHLYQNSPTNYSILQGEMSPGFRIIDPQGHYTVTAYPDTTAPPADEGLTMISPSSLTSFEFGLKKATVASTKVREQADRKRKSQARFYCSFCSADFTAKHNLQFHENSHKGEKPYACRYCSTSFTVPRSRDRHEKNCKQGISPGRL
ncbi:MAG: hypothetical protein NXY57DRAFT_131812 [Lentinula lateritia]|nr:MAG: hypothetical protein NXY57DRAFT_131812 [Lentinula lateritia]